MNTHPRNFIKNCWSDTDGLVLCPASVPCPSGSESDECPMPVAQSPSMARRMRRYRQAFRAGAAAVQWGPPGLVNVIDDKSEVNAASVVFNEASDSIFGSDAHGHSLIDTDVSLYTDAEPQDGTGERTPMPEALGHSLHVSIGAGAGRPVLAHSVPSAAQQWPSISGTTEEASSFAGKVLASVSTTEPLECGGGSTGVASQVQAGCLGGAEKEGDDSISSVEAPSDDEGYDADSDEDNNVHVPVDVAGSGGDDAPSNAGVDAGCVNPLDAVYELVSGLCCSGLRCGDAVVLHGLQSDAGLNGKHGHIVGTGTAEQRISVALVIASGRKAVRASNLLVVRDAWASLADVFVGAEARGLADVVAEALQNLAMLGIMEIDMLKSRVRFTGPFDVQGRVELQRDGANSVQL